MATYHILFNPYAGNGNGEQEAHRLDALFSGETLVYHNMTEIASYEDFFRSIESDTNVVLCGGDGTLNRFLNDTAGVGIPNELVEMTFYMISEKKRAPLRFPLKNILKICPR